MKTYIITTNINDSCIKNDLIEGSLIRLNSKIEVDSTIFIYTYGATVPGVYAIARMKTCEEIERGIFIGTAIIMRKENYPMLENEDFDNLGIKPNFVMEVTNEDVKKSMFSLMDRIGDELLSKFMTVDDVANELNVCPQTIYNWYENEGNLKAKEVKEMLPLFYKDIDTGKLYWHKKSIKRFNTFKNYMESNALANITPIHTIRENKIN